MNNIISINRLTTPLNQMTKWRMKGNLRNWLHLCNQRCKSDTQWETQQYANVIAHTYIKSLWPKTYNLWQEYTHNAVTFSATEIQQLRDYINLQAPLSLTIENKLK
jgi:thymidylate synthase ThyX